MTPKELDRFMNRHDVDMLELAEALGVTYGAVHHWLCGRRPIPKMVTRILDYMDDTGVNVRELGDG